MFACGTSRVWNLWGEGWLGNYDGGGSHCTLNRGSGNMQPWSLPPQDAANTIECFWGLVLDNNRAACWPRPETICYWCWWLCHLPRCPVKKNIYAQVQTLAIDYFHTSTYNFIKTHPYSFLICTTNVVNFDHDQLLRMSTNIVMITAPDKNIAYRQSNGVINQVTPTPDNFSRQNTIYLFSYYNIWQQWISGDIFVVH